MDDDVLHGYLQNHWAAATGGLSLFRRMAGSHGDPSVAQAVGALVPEVDEERETLRAVMQAVGTSPSLIGTVAGRVGEELGRLKPNGRLLTRSPLTDVVEVEALRVVVFAKRGCWEVLRGVADHDPRLDVPMFDDLTARADAQLARLQELHAGTARKRIVA